MQKASNPSFVAHAKSSNIKFHIDLSGNLSKRSFNEIHVVYTKGDANHELDPWSVRRDAVEAKVTRVIPDILPVITGVVLAGLLLRLITWI